jgi:hypothetical protein
MEERTKDRIHDTLKSGGSITETKSHNQELIVALMNTKCHLYNVFIFHMSLVVAKTKVEFGKLLSPTNFIQKVIYDKNGDFFLNGKFVEGKKN